MGGRILPQGQNSKNHCDCIAYRDRSKESEISSSISIISHKLQRFAYSTFAHKIKSFYLNLSKVNESAIRPETTIISAGDELNRFEIQVSRRALRAESILELYRV